MRVRLAAVLLVALTSIVPAANGQSPEGADRAEVKIDDIITRMNKAESGVAVRMRMYHPLVEVYIQNLVPDEQLGWVPTRDDYFLGQFDLGETAKLRPISQTRKAAGVVSRVTGAKAIQY